MNKRIVSLAVACMLVAVVAMVDFVTASPAHAAPVLCNDSDPFLRSPVSNGRYIVQNNVWGASTRQCVDVNQSGPGFTVTEAQHNNTGANPASYPSMIFGCHWAPTPADCSSGSGLPLQANTAAFNNISTSVTMTYPGTGRWDAAYDIWFDPTPRINGQPTGAEVMVWLNHTSGIFAVGSQIATVNLLGASWEVWFGNIGWNVISYRRVSPTNSLSFSVNTFYTDAVNRGFAQRAWYLTSIQAGFEPWIGGAGLAVNSFSVSNSPGGGGDTQPPSTPGNLSAFGTTSSATNLSWSAATDNVGVSGYDILRAPGVSGGTFAQIGTSTSTSFSSTGLAAATTYRFQVRARDAAGLTSGVSNTVTVTTPTGGGGGGCSAALTVQSQWGTGYVAQPVNVTNTGSSTINAWAVTFTLPAGHIITGSWNTNLTVNGQTVTARNAASNGTVAPNATVNWGFQASRPDGNSALPAGLSCTSP